MPQSLGWSSSFGRALQNRSIALNPKRRWRSNRWALKVRAGEMQPDAGLFDFHASFAFGDPPDPHWGRLFIPAPAGRLSETLRPEHRGRQAPSGRRSLPKSRTEESYGSTRPLACPNGS